MNNTGASAILRTIVALPFLYLASIYPDLPVVVPIRFGPDGMPIAYGPRAMLWILPIAGPLLLAVIYSFVLPRATFSGRPRKLWWMKILTTTCMSVIMVYLVWDTVRGELVGLHSLYFVLGGLLAILGNFMPVIPPNRWVGIRLPITLRDHEV